MYSFVTVMTSKQEQKMCIEKVQLATSSLVTSIELKEDNQFIILKLTQVLGLGPKYS